MTLLGPLNVTRFLNTVYQDFLGFFCLAAIILLTNSSLLPQAPVDACNLPSEGLKHNGLVLIAFNQTTQTHCVTNTPAHSCCECVHSYGE